MSFGRDAPIRITRLEREGMARTLRDVPLDEEVLMHLARLPGDDVNARVRHLLGIDRR
jgi:hypothetical protein